MFLRALLLGFALLWSGAVPEKKQPQFTITYEKQTHQLVLMNPEPAPYTVTLHFVPFENVRMDCDNPCTLVLSPFSLPSGTPVHAARAGQVIWIEDRFSEGGIEERFQGKDNRVEILHDDGSIALYGHLKYRGVLVQPGQAVTVGQILGYSGSTGYSGGPHLHFQVHHVLNGEARTTVPTLFRTAAGLQILKSGQSYLRP